MTVTEEEQDKAGKEKRIIGRRWPGRLSLEKVKTWGKWIVQLVIQEKSIPEGEQQEQVIWARLSFFHVYE